MSHNAAVVAIVRLNHANHKTGVKYIWVGKKLGPSLGPSLFIAILGVLIFFVQDGKTALKLANDPEVMRLLLRAGAFSEFSIMVCMKITCFVLLLF